MNTNEDQLLFKFTQKGAVISSNVTVEQFVKAFLCGVRYCVPFGEAILESARLLAASDEKLRKSYIECLNACAPEEVQAEFQDIVDDCECCQGPNINEADGLAELLSRHIGKNENFKC